MSESAHERSLNERIIAGLGGPAMVHIEQTSAAFPDSILCE